MGGVKIKKIKYFISEKKQEKPIYNIHPNLIKLQSLLKFFFEYSFCVSPIPTRERIIRNNKI